MELFITENYLTFLLLGGLAAVMVAYKDVHLPATRSFLMIIFILLLMCASSGLERWAVLSPDRESIRVLASVIHYVLQPFVIYLELIIIMPESERNNKQRHFLLALPLILNTVIYLAAPFTGTLVFNYDEDYCFNRGPLGYSIYIVTFFYLALLLLWSIQLFHDNEKRKSIILFFIVLAALLTGVLEGLNIVTGYIDEAFALGVFLYYMYLVTIHESAMRSDMARKELQLSESKIKLLREQIQPHFIFNSLQAIKALIRKDPPRAIISLEDFSDYLRANLDVMTSDNLIPFDDELEHIEAYVSLVTAGNSRNIDMQYEIGERDFSLPPLTVEPLVENALRYGVKDGGVVRLTTCKEENSIKITVSDNGKGFDDMENKKDRIGIGIENVRTRLASLCGGTLDITSGDGGTVVTVSIPAGKE